MTEALGKFDLSGKSLMLPLILSYADDLVLMSDNLEDLESFVNEFSEAAAVGLQLNSLKCELLLRDTSSDRPALPKTVRIGRYDIPTVTKLKHLGIFLTDGLNRPLIVRERVKTAYKVAYSLLPFLKKNKLTSETIRGIYLSLSVIVPVVSYGLKATVMVKANRIALTRMEGRILEILLTTASDRPLTSNPRSILRNRTILKTVAVNRLRVGRPCYVWEDALKQEVLRMGYADKLDQVIQDDFDLKEIEQIIYEAETSEEE